MRGDPVNGTDPTGEEECGWACKAWQGFTSYLAQTLTRSEQVRNDLNSKRANLDPLDTDARSALKRTARTQTPAPMRAIINSLRPSTGPRPGSVGGAARGNPAWTRAAKIAGGLGRASAVTSLVFGGIQIATSKNPAREASGVGGSTLGGVGGGIALAEAGGALGLLGGPFAPVTVPGGAIIGGIAGSMGGGWLGDKAGKSIYDKVNQ